MRHLTIATFAAALLLTAAACGDPRLCACSLKSTPAGTSSARIVATAAIASATPQPSPPGDSSRTPPATATLMPPDPRSITPRPTDPPVTVRPRPRMPVADDIRLGPDARYYADVDRCHWSEVGRVRDSQSGEVVVVMQTPCLPYEGLHYNPRTGSIAYFIA